MTQKIILDIAIILIIAILILALKLCNKFRKKVYKLFIKAEKEITGSEDKMSYVVNQIYYAIPSVVRLFVNEKLIKYILQKMFNLIEDFLNDGVINSNYEKESEN